MWHRCSHPLARQEVGLWLLFVRPRARRCREVVVRTLNDTSWSDLETRLEEEEEAPKVRAIQATGDKALRSVSADPDSPLTLCPLAPPAMPSGSGLTARYPTSHGSLWFHVLCPTPAWCHQRGHRCSPRGILESRSHFPLGPLRNLVTSACR